MLSHRACAHRRPALPARHLCRHAGRSHLRRAVLAQRDAEIALSPGFRWGADTAAGQPITWDDVYNATAITYPAVYRITMNGAAIKAVLEDVADNLFNPDPYYQQGGDMVRSAAWALRSTSMAAMGERHQQYAPAQVGGGPSRQARTTWLPAGPRSTKVRRAPRSGMWWRRIVTGPCGRCRRGRDKPSKFVRAGN